MFSGFGLYWIMDQYETWANVTVGLSKRLFASRPRCHGANLEIDIQSSIRYGLVIYT